MEYEKQIEIKLDGNKCIINIPPQDQTILSSTSLNKILSQNNNSLTNIDDISFSVSLTSDDNMNSKNNFYNYNYNNKINNENKNNNQKYLYSNEKSKLEITYQSIFYSDLKSDSSNMKTPLLLLNCKNNIESQEKKDSVVKRLNFDLSNSNNSKNRTNNSNYNNSNNSNSNCNSINNTVNKVSNISNDILNNIHKMNTDIQNINIRKLPSLNRNNIVKKISKNLNKEYFIHEKIFSINKNEKETKNTERLKMDKKVKENSIKNGNKQKNDINDISNKSYIKNNNNIKMEMPNISNRQTTESCLSKVKSNTNILNKNKKPDKYNINNHLMLYKCPSKPNISNMKLKLNNMMKLNPKYEKENINIISNENKEEIDNNNSNEIETQENKIDNNNVLIKNEYKKFYPRLSSAKSFSTATKTSNLKTHNSYNQSAKISKLQKNNTKNNNNNSNLKTPLLLNKQIILSTPKTNSYSCSTSYSAKNNKSTGNIKYFENKSSDLKMDNNKILENLKNDKKDPILCKIEAHNSLLKNFFFFFNNYKTQEKSDEYIATNNNISNNNGNEKTGKNYLEESINNKMTLRKFNTDLKIPMKKTKQLGLGLLTERNINNNYYNNNYGRQIKYNNANDLQKLFRKNEFDMELLNSIKK